MSLQLVSGVVAAPPVTRLVAVLLSALVGQTVHAEVPVCVTQVPATELYGVTKSFVVRCAPASIAAPIARLPATVVLP